MQTCDLAAHFYVPRKARSKSACRKPESRVRGGPAASCSADCALARLRPPLGSCFCLLCTPEMPAERHNEAKTRSRAGCLTCPSPSLRNPHPALSLSPDTQLPADHHPLRTQAVDATKSATRRASPNTVARADAASPAAGTASGPSRQATSPCAALSAGANAHRLPRRRVAGRARRRRVRTAPGVSCRASKEGASSPVRARSLFLLYLRRQTTTSLSPMQGSPRRSPSPAPRTSLTSRRPRHPPPSPPRPSFPRPIRQAPQVPRRPTPTPRTWTSSRRRRPSPRSSRRRSSSATTCRTSSRRSTPKSDTGTRSRPKYTSRAALPPTGEAQQWMQRAHPAARQSRAPRLSCTPGRVSRRSPRPRPRPPSRHSATLAPIESASPLGRRASGRCWAGA